MAYRVNKQKCIGCQMCLTNCPGATKMGSDGKAVVIDQKKLEECGGESVCPVGAIEKVSEEGDSSEEDSRREPSSSSSFTPGAGSGQGLGRGRGPGWSRGMGRQRRAGRR